MSERRRRKSLLSTSVSGLFFGTSSSTHSGKTGLCASGQPDGKYSASSAYRAFFHGAASLPGAKELWRTKAPARVKLFYWLDIHRRLWTAEHRKRHGLQDEDACALCNQEPETADHLLVGCVVTRELWSSLLAPLGLQTLAPTREEDATLWWLREWRQIDKAFRHHDLAARMDCLEGEERAHIPETSGNIGAAAPQSGRRGRCMGEGWFQIARDSDSFLVATF